MDTLLDIQLSMGEDINCHNSDFHQPVNLASSVIPAFHIWVTPLKKDPNTEEETGCCSLKQSNMKELQKQKPVLTTVFIDI